MGLKKPGTHCVPVHTKSRPSGLIRVICACAHSSLSTGRGVWFKLTYYSFTLPPFFLIQLSDLFFQLIILYGTVAYLLYLVITVTEMVVMKTIYILRFSRIAAMNENFITLNLILFNGVFISWNIIMRLTLREFEVNPWLYLYFDYKPINRFLDSENRPLLLIM